MSRSPHAARRFAALVVAACAALLAVGAPAVAAPTSLPAPHALTLRLPDLGPNYELGSSRCGNRSRDEERWWPSTLPSLSRRFPHEGCVIAFAESWAVPGAPPLSGYVMSAAFAFSDAAGPTAAFQRPRAVAAHMLDATSPPLPPPAMPANVLDADQRGDMKPLSIYATLGDELRAFRLAGYPKPGTVLLWRSGSVLALVLAAGPANDHTTQAAIRLATAQQSRIATPTPLLPPDLDDTEVPLGDPHLGVPVAWLGREMPGAGGRPPLSLHAVDGVQPSRFDARAVLYYGSRDPKTYVNVSLLKPRPVRRELQRLGRYLHQRICMRRYDGSADGVPATIIAYHMPPRRRCGPRPFNGFQTFAFLPGVAVTIEAGSCYRCRRRSPYASVAGMRALVRALRIREPAATASTP